MFSSSFSLSNLCRVHRERESKRAEMAAREATLERQLRQLHTWDTQLAAKQRQMREYTELVGCAAGGCGACLVVWMAGLRVCN